MSGLALQSSHLFHICGLEIASGLQACQNMGFDFIQGYYYGQPTQGGFNSPAAPELV
ncbi:hypothetical protein [Halioglobus sp. HI00S01]|uniref:hypothetical protein n=1 Tax=Halioglobus sp. HI00S01 TaxID=1822214 RepID=UPI0012E71140|nr:hypothetical protein [Halioglobus sp. HI00S01]